MHALRIAHPKMTLLIGKPVLQILKSVCVESANNKLQLKSAGLFTIASRAIKRTMAGVCPSNMFQKTWFSSKQSWEHKSVESFFWICEWYCRVKNLFYSTWYMNANCLSAIYLLFMTPTWQAENETSAVPTVAPLRSPRQDGWRVQAGKAAKNLFGGSCHLRSLEGLLTDQGMGHIWSVSMWTYFCFGAGRNSRCWTSPSELDSALLIFFQPFRSPIEPSLVSKFIYFQGF